MINYYLYQHQTSDMGDVYKAITIFRESKDKDFIFKAVAEQLKAGGKDYSVEQIKAMTDLYFSEMKNIAAEGREVETPFVNFKRKHDEVESAINPDYEGEMQVEPSKKLQDAMQDVQLEKLDPKKLYTAIFSFKEIVKTKESLELEHNGLYVIEGKNLNFDINNEEHGIFLTHLKKQIEIQIEDFELVSDEKIVFKVSPDFPYGYYDLSLRLDSADKDEYSIHTLSEAIHI